MIENIDLLGITGSKQGWASAMISWVFGVNQVNPKAKTGTPISPKLIYGIPSNLIIHPGTGSVTYDSDGAGAGSGMQITMLGINLTLTHADFVVF